MLITTDDAVVLRRIEYSETSQVLVFFAREHGKVRAIAKGARRSTKRRFSPGIDLLEAGRLSVSIRQPRQESLATLTEWVQGRAFLGLRDKLGRFNAGQYAADVVAKLTDDWDPHPPLYAVLYQTLETFEVADDVLAPLVTFQRSLLTQVGLLPQFDSCTGCGRGIRTTRGVYFSSFEGGLVCRDCEPARVEKRRVAASIQALRGTSACTAKDLAALFDLFNYHVAHLIGRPPATAEYFAGRAKDALESRD
jgi:DNA repair protein RecO (recombination protein O)